jgi:WD40 repeat protein
VKSVSFSPCGGRIASASGDCTIKVWEASTGICQSTLSVDSNVYSVAFSPNGEEIVAGCGRCIYLWRQAEDGGGKKWEIRSECPLRGHMKDNPECICFREEEEEDSDDEKPFPRPECPATGHWYVPFPCVECLLS